METKAQGRKEMLAQEGARAGGFRLHKIQREVGCIFCKWFDLVAAMQEKPYCKAPIKFGDLTIEIYVTNTEAKWTGPDIRHRCHKHERIGEPTGREAPILDNGGRKVASLEN